MAVYEQEERARSALETFLQDVEHKLNEHLISYFTHEVVSGKMQWEVFSSFMLGLLIDPADTPDINNKLIQVFDVMHQGDGTRSITASCASSVSSLTSGASRGAVRRHVVDTHGVVGNQESCLQGQVPVVADDGMQGNRVPQEPEHDGETHHSSTLEGELISQTSLDYSGTTQF